jgi:hypothetical protein
MVDEADLAVLMNCWEQEAFDPSLVAHWPLDEAQGVIAYNNASDCDGTLINGPVWQAGNGILAGALQLDGIDDYVSTDFVLNPSDGVFSVAAWIKDGAPGQTIISQTDSSNWLCLDSTEGCLMTELKNSGRSSSNLLLSDVNVTDGNWHRISLVFDGSYRYLYADGTEIVKDASPSHLENASNGLYFGVGSTLAPGTFFSGMIDDIRIYNRIVYP